MVPRTARGTRPSHRPRLLRLIGAGGLLSAVTLLGGAAPGLARDAVSSVEPTAQAAQDGAGSVWRQLPGARAGSLVSRAGITVVAPRAGLAVHGDALMADGSERWLSVRTTRAGRVLVADEPAALRTPAAAAGAAAIQGTPTPAVLDVCADKAYTLTGSWWHDTTFQWSFQSSSTPSELRVGRTVKALRAGVADITREYNSCGRADHVSATSAYRGTTPTRPDIGAPQTCLGNGDGINVVAFGRLGWDIVAFSCWWYTGTTNVEADMLLNKHDFDWTTTLSGCHNAYIVRAIATHEFGHIYGLGHVSESQHPLLTMSEAAAPCDDSPSTLGLGDMRGLEHLY